MDSLNNIGKLNYAVKKLSEFETGSQTVIKALRFMNTQYGKRLVADLTDGQIVFLPERFNCLSDSDLGELNTRSHIIMIYEGKQVLPNGRSAHIIHFE